MKNNLRDEQIWLAVGSLMILALAAAAMILVYTKGFLIPFVLAVFVTIMISPVLDFQVIRWKFPHWAAVTTSLVLVLGLLALMGSLLYAAIPRGDQAVIGTPHPTTDESSSIGSIDPDQHYESGFAGLLDDLTSTLQAWGLDVDQTVLEKELQSFLAELQEKAVYIISQTAGTVASLFSQGFLILIFIIFLLAGRNPHAVRAGIYADVESKVRTYITTKFVLSAVTGLAVWIVLALFGLKMAALFGLMAFVLNYIPSIGSVIATLLPLPVALAQFGDPFSPWAILGVVAIPGAVQMTVGNVIEPKIMGQGLQLHPVTILLALAFWGLLWGVIGMLLAVPLTATIRIVLVRFEITAPIGDLLAGELPGAGGKVGAVEAR